MALFETGGTRTGPHKSFQIFNKANWSSARLAQSALDPSSAAAELNPAWRTAPLIDYAVSPSVIFAIGLP
jgi:hypothetical protein